MKGLSVKQPYAMLIDPGLKTIEARSWRTKFRGDLLICSSLRPDKYALSCLPKKHLAYTNLLGVALCIVEVVDCVPFAEEHCDEAMMDMPDAPYYAWILDNLRQIRDPFPVKGKVGFMNIDLPPGTVLGEGFRVLS
jgi:hypothetical protein